MTNMIFVARSRTLLPLISSLLLLLFSCILQVRANDPQYLFHSCNVSDTNYTSGGKFESNLNSLIQELYYDARYSIFSNKTTGELPDRVYGLFVCRGDGASSVCQRCFEIASDQILHNLCPFEKEAMIIYDACMIRYSDEYFFSIMEDTPSFCMSDPANITEPGNLDEILADTFGNLTALSTSDPSKAMYTSSDVNISSSMRLYAMVQCTPDLSLEDCRRCLSSAAETSQSCSVGRIGGKYVTPSCNARYEFFPMSAANNDSKNGQGTSSKKTVIAISTSLSSFLVVVLLGSYIFYWRSRKRKEEEEKERSQDRQLLDMAGGRFTDSYTDEELQGEINVKSQDYPSIKLDLILAATNHFSKENKLGEGGFGPVYKGTLADGKEVAVKRLSRASGQGLQEFKNEVTLIARLQHWNLVRLLGCCLEGRELLLLYEYMPNKSLDVFLFDSTRGSELDWKKRFSIINGIARGILYLHEDSRLRIIHRDLKASNVLLDHEMNPKISDFGMARIFSRNQIEVNTNRVVGTYGYMAPEYAMEGLFSVKSDVFSFGVLLLEIICGQRNTGFYRHEHGQSLLTFAWKLWCEGKGMELMDPLLLESFVEVEVLKCIQIGLLCAQEDPADRPTMSSVVFMLGGDTITLPKPKKPAFTISRPVKESAQFIESSSKASSANEVTISTVTPR